MDVFKLKKMLNIIKNVVALWCVTVSVNSVSAQSFSGFVDTGDLISNVEVLSKAKTKTKEESLTVPKDNYSFVRKLEFHQNGKKVYDFYWLKHKPSNTIVNIKVHPKKDGFNLDSSNNFIRCVCQPNSDRGETHTSEHYIARRIRNYLNNKHNLNLTLSDFSAYTDDFGFTISTKRNLCDEDYYKNVFSQFKAENLKEDAELFNVEKRRVYHEDRNASESQNAKYFRLRNIRNFNPGGNYSDVEKLTIEEIESWIKQNVVPSNIVIDLNFSRDEGQKLHDTLTFLSAILDDFQKTRPSSLNNFGKYTEYKKDASVYKMLKYSDDTQTFSGKGLDGGVQIYKYCAILDIDVSSMSASEKDSLLLNSAVYEFFLKKLLKKYGIESIEVNSSDVLHGFLTLYLRTNDIKNLANENLAVATCRDLIKTFYKNLELNQKNVNLTEFSNYVNCAILPNYSFRDVALKSETYRKGYSFENLRYYSLLKYGDQFSDKVFCYKNGILDDNVKVVEENILNNAVAPFSKLESQRIYITVLEQDNYTKKSSYEDDDLFYIVPIKYGRKNTPAYIKMLTDGLLTSVLNPLVKDKTYNCLLSACYPGSGPICFTNKESQAEINAYLKENLQNIINSIKSNNYNYRYLIEVCKKNLKYDIERYRYVSNAIERYCEDLCKICAAADDKMRVSGKDKNINYFLDFEDLYLGLRRILEGEPLLFLNKDGYEEFEIRNKNLKRQFNAYLNNGGYLNDITGLYFMNQLLTPYVKLMQDAYVNSIKFAVNLLQEYDKIDLNNDAAVEQVKEEILKCISNAKYTLK